MLTKSEIIRCLDYDIVSGIFRWKINKSKSIKIGNIAGTISKNGYRRISINNKIYMSHRLAWLYVYGHFPDGELDHINGDRSNNAISNLRIVNRSGNNQNKTHGHKNNKSGLLGVDFKRNKWRAQIAVRGKKIHIGYFSTKEDAHNAYIEKKRIVHKENCFI